MHHSLFTFKPNIVNDICIKDPLSSSVGLDIIRKGNEIISEKGFEYFTFKKLASEIQTTEATVYRYFENKHKFLLYLTSYYWSWIEYRFFLKNNNVDNSVTKLQNAIEIMSGPLGSMDEVLDYQKLFSIIISESSKSYMNRFVDDYNKHGGYYNYKKIVAYLREIIIEINPDYLFPNMLVSTIIEGIHHQIFFGQHLPSLTDKIRGENDLAGFYIDLALSQILKNKY